MKPKVLILTQKSLHKAPRVFKEIDALKDTFEIHTVGTSPSKREDHFIFIKKLPLWKKIPRCIFLLIRCYEKFYWDFYKLDLLKRMEGNKYDLIIAHDEDALPLAFKMSNGVKVILNAHEYLPEESSHIFLWRWLMKPYIEYLCSTYSVRTDLVLTVNESISQLYSDNFKLKCTPLYNASEYVELIPTEVHNPIKIIHHGVATSNRKLERMVQMMDYLNEKYTLDLMVDPVSSEKNAFRKLKNEASLRKTVRLINPVSFKEIVQTINQYDIGLYIFPPVNFNSLYALPNKFFEFIQARLVIAVAPSPEMKKLVERYDLGIVAKDFNPKSMAEEILKLTPEKIKYCKNQCHKFAKELSSEKEIEKIKNTITQLMS